jgi:hypothetical protein
MTFDEYRQGMLQNRELYEDRYANYELGERNKEVMHAVTGGREMNVLVLTEDWCGDSLRYVPVLERMAEAAGRWNVRIFYRDQSPDLADRWLKRGAHRAIPVIVFFDREMCELAHFIEKPAGVYAADAQGREEFARSHADLQDAHLRHNEMSEGTYNLYLDFLREYRAANLARWQQMFADEVLGMLDGVECEAA